MKECSDKESWIEKFRKTMASEPLMLPIPSTIDIEPDKELEEIRSILADLIGRSKDYDDSMKLLKVYDYVNKVASKGFINLKISHKEE
jgi:hypothetical protein